MTMNGVSIKMAFKSTHVYVKQCNGPICIGDATRTGPIIAVVTLLFRVLWQQKTIHDNVDVCNSVRFGRMSCNCKMSLWRREARARYSSRAQLIARLVFGWHFLIGTKIEIGNSFNARNHHKPNKRMFLCLHFAQTNSWTILRMCQRRTIGREEDIQIEFEFEWDDKEWMCYRVELSKYSYPQSIHSFVVFVFFFHFMARIYRMKSKSFFFPIVCCLLYDFSSQHMLPASKDCANK